MSERISPRARKIFRACLDRARRHHRAALPDRAVLPLRRPGLDPDAVALGDRRPRRAHLDADRPHRAGAAARRDRGGGRPFLPPPRHRFRGAARGDQGNRRGRRPRRGARRLDHHPAGGQEPVSLAGPQLRAQGARVPARPVARPGAAEAAPDGDLPQHRRLGAERRVRHRGRGAPRLQQGRRATSPPRRRRCSPPRCPTRAGATRGRPRPALRRLAGVYQGRMARWTAIDACVRPQGATL